MKEEVKQRVVKNTLILYIRMLFIMIVTLYISRLLLKSLGVQDFGIYNVVGGVVLMFSFLNNAMASSTQRFLSYEIGCDNKDELKAIFSTSLIIHFLIGFVIFILAETIGIWFLNTKMSIPVERIVAANWVYQFSVLSFLISVIQVPFYSCVIAHEQMKVYSYVSIVDILLKLASVVVLLYITWDRLIVYAGFSLLIILLITVLYVIYCVKNYDECNFRIIWYKRLFYTMSSYAGWSLYGSLASVLSFQGINVLLNIFFGPLINAARAIAFQVNTAIYSFTANFQMAVNPRIVKLFAAKDHLDTMLLVYRSSRFSFYLLLFISLPVYFELKFILHIWLETVPEYTLIFTRLIIINALIDCISNPLMILAQAIGQIKLYQFCVGSILLLNLPISYFVLLFGYAPEYTMYISITLSSVAFCSRLIILKKIIDFKVNEFLVSVCLRCFLVAAMCFIFPFLITFFIEESVYRFFIVCFACVFVSLPVYWLIGISNEERNFFRNKINNLWTTLVRRILLNS